MINQTVLVYLAWSILTKCAGNRETITYKQLGNALRMHHRPVRFILAPIQDYCLSERLPPLTILVVNQRGIPGSGFIALDSDRFEEGRDEVFSHPWNTHPNPFEFARDGTQYKSLLKQLLANPKATEDIYRRVSVRGVGQIIFRDLLLQIYGRRCCFSGFTIPEGLEAVHIVPWAVCDNKNRLDVTNGLLLSSLHHRLFDAGILTLTSDYKIVFCPPKRAYSDIPEFERAVTSDLHLTEMKLPRSTSHYPSREFIVTRNSMLNLKKYLPDGA